MEELYIQRDPLQCGAAPTWGKGLAIRVKPLLLPSNMFFLFLSLFFFFFFCGPMGCFNLTPGF